MERMMKAQEVILKAAAGKLKWWDAAEIMGVTDRTMRRWRERLDQNGYSGLWDYGKRSPSPKGSDENGGGGVATLPGEVLRLQRAALSREAARVARYSAELQLGEDGTANRRAGQAANFRDSCVGT